MVGCSVDAICPIQNARQSHGGHLVKFGRPLGFWLQCMKVVTVKRVRGLEEKNRFSATFFSFVLKEVFHFFISLVYFLLKLFPIL